MIRHERHGIAIINQFAVRLVRNHVERMPDACLQLLKHLLQTVKRLRGINHAGRVIGIVYNEKLRFFRNEIFQRVNIELKCLCVSGGCLQHAACYGHIVCILAEKRGERDDLIPGIEEKVQHIINRGGCSGSHNDVIHPEIRAKACVQIICHRTAHCLKAGIIHISVNLKRVLCVQYLKDGLFYRVRRRYTGIPQAVVINILCADTLGHFLARLK